MNLLEERGAQISFHDPFVPRLHKMRKYNFRGMTSSELTEELLEEQDAVLIATDHSIIDYQWIVDHSALVVDTRGVTRKITGNPGKVVQA